MTKERLQSILQSENKLTLSEVKQIIYELKNDCIGVADVTNAYQSGYYNGEVNAFYICLDLLDKLVDEKLDSLIEQLNKENGFIMQKEACDAALRVFVGSSQCSHCERDVIICKEEGRCMKEYSNG